MSKWERPTMQKGEMQGNNWARNLERNQQAQEKQVM